MNNLELTDINNYRLNKISKVKDYFNDEINERKNIIKQLNKYLVSFDFLDKMLITLSASIGTLSISSHVAIVGIPVGTYQLVGTGINKSLLQITKKRKKETQ